MPEKNGVSYLNIKWPYRFASHFLLCSCKHAKQKKSYKHFMLSSQHRNTPDNKPGSCKHAMSLLSGLKPCRPSLHKAAWLPITKPGNSHRFIFMPSPSSRSMAKPTGSKEASPIFYLKQVQHSVLKPPQSLRSKCPMAVKKKLLIAATVSITGIEVHCCNQ